MATKTQKFNLNKIANTFSRLNPHLYSMTLKLPLPCFPLLFSEIRCLEPVKNVTRDVSAILKESFNNKERDRDSEDREKFDFNWPEYQKAVENLNSCLAADNLQNFHKILQQKDLDEEQLTVAIGVHIIKKLCEKAVTGKKKAKMKCVCGCGEGLEEGNMWIGSSATWHGELDLLAGTKTNISVTPSIYEEQEEEDDEDSPGKDIYEQELFRIISQAIVFGFTEYNRHKDCSPYIPSVMIDKERFLVFIYNPVVDSLFFTGFVPYFEPDFQPDKFEPTGIIFLWIVLNHRLFFRKGLPVTYQIPCGFKRSCGVKTLGHYQNLDQYKVCVTTRTAPNLMRDWTWPMFLPPDLGETEG